MNTITLEKYGHVISDSALGATILNNIISVLDQERDVIIDFSGVISMATFCSKQIFGNLYVKLTPQVFFDRIKLVNASHEMKVIIRLGIEKALADKNMISS